MDPVDTVIEDDRWDAFGLAPLALRAVSATLKDRGLGAEGYALCLMACDDARIAELNASFRGKAQPTNVLSWPSEERGAEIDGEEPEPPAPGDSDDPEELGDIAIAWETCLREAAEQEKTMEAHVTHLIVHATLHLLGYDHLRERDATLMEDAERRILATLGISDPY
jgi:probable rRNA maturation factor